MKPGLYKHYRGNLYRVLFTAPWWGLTGVIPENAPLRVAVNKHDVQVRPSDFDDAPDDGLFRLLWSGNHGFLPAFTLIVIYVALYGDGRVSARTVEEFEEQVGLPGGTIMRPRFEWVGP